MKLYAEIRSARNRQIAADVFVALWFFVWTALGFWVRSLVLALAEPARQVEAAGNDVARAAGEAGREAGGLPVFGEFLVRPFDALEQAARQVAGAGAAQQEAMTDVATLIGLVTAVAPILSLFLIWAWWRMRWIREATAAAELRDAGGGADLFALRALAHRSLDDLRAVGGPDPYTALSTGESEALAALELRKLGLRASSRSRVPSR